MKFKTVCILIIASIAIASCRKYDNGPGLSLRSKKERIANNWRISQVIDDGQDVTDDYENYRLMLSKTGSAQLTAKYNWFGATIEYSTSGTWELQSNNERIYMNFDDDDADATYRITKLYEDEMWLLEEAENREFHLIPQ